MKKIIQGILEKYAKQLLDKYNPKVVVITGSVGKTSTRNAIVQVLQKQFKVLKYHGNFNVDMSVPVVLFGLQYPKKVRNPFEWLKVFSKMKKIIKNGYDYDVVVLELALDNPGDIQTFTKYLTPDISVITAISPEHMENFDSMEALAKEEMLVTLVSKTSIINRDDISKEYDKFNSAKQSFTYGFNKGVDYTFIIDKFSLHYGYDGKLAGGKLKDLKTQARVVGKHNLKPIIAAAAVADQLDVPAKSISSGIADIVPVPGRLNLLKGAEDSIILDDSYNSSPLAASAALRTLYDFDSPAKFAILGSMNELGTISPKAHQEIGSLCDPSKLDLLLTIGEDAERYLAPAARQNGCKVESFSSPYDAGAFLRAKLRRGAVVLVKGSQNRVFSEEAIKLLLENPDDEKYLVRQDEEWMQIKRQQFDSHL